MQDKPRPDDGLNDDRTFMGEREEVVEGTNNIGAEVTRGDSTDSSKDEFQQVLEAFDEVIDLEKRYEIQGKLGAGGMGTVLKAVDKRLGRIVALKFLLEEFDNNAQALRRFITEAKAIARLNHSNIVQLYEMERSAEGPFIVMEYVEGGSLADVLENGPLELETAVDIICQVCDGLGVAHDQGITHRDIKPANILMTTAGVPKLSDFGLARQASADHGQTQVGAILGTIDFMPPEQRRDATAVDARSDLWSLAATLYQMVTGRSPKVIRLDLVDESLRPILAQALEDAQDDRYQTALDFRNELAASLESADSGMPIEVDLGAGECPTCRAKNEASRKFCRNCGASLREPCLGCGIEIGAWETFCPECGTNTRDTLKLRQQELDAQKTRIESHRQKYELEQAIELLGSLTAISQPQLASYCEWGQETLEQCQQQQEELVQLREQALDAAEVAYAEFNEAEALRLLEQIPVPFREERDEKAISQCKTQIETVNDLRSEILRRIKDKQIDGLTGKVQAYLALRPQDQAALNLLKQLSGRDKSPIVFETVKRRPLGLGMQAGQITPDIIYEVKPGHFKTYEIMPGSLRTISPATSTISPATSAMSVDDILAAARAGVTRYRSEALPAKRASVKVRMKWPEGNAWIIPARPARFEVPNPFRPGEVMDVPGTPEREHPGRKKEFILEKIQNREEVENAVASNQPNFDTPLEITYTNYAGERKVFVAASNTIQRYPGGIYVVVAPSTIPIFLKKDRIENWDDVELFL